MSAFDIAGAVVWTPLAVLFWIASWGGANFGWIEIVALGAGYIGGGMHIATLLSLASAFCIARLFGATL